MKKSRLIGAVIVSALISCSSTISQASLISYDSVSKNASGSIIANNITSFTCVADSVADQDISNGGNNVSVSTPNNDCSFAWTAAASYDLTLDSTGFLLIETADAETDLSTNHSFGRADGTTTTGIVFTLSELTNVYITAEWARTSFGGGGANLPNVELKPVGGTTNLLTGLIGTFAETTSGAVTQGENITSLWLGSGTYIFSTHTFAFANGSADGLLASVGSSTSIIGVSIVPIPAAAWLFGSGLLGLVGIARRKKA